MRRFPKRRRLVTAKGKQRNFSDCLCMQVELKDLDLSFNSIEAIQAPQLRPLTRLSSLSLYSNQLQTLAYLPPLPALRHLSIGALLMPVTLVSLNEPGNC